MYLSAKCEVYWRWASGYYSEFSFKFASERNVYHITEGTPTPPPPKKKKMSRSWTSLILQPPSIGHVSRNLSFPTLILKGEWNYKFQKENKTMCQRFIQNPAKHLRCRVLQKLLTTDRRSLFSQNAPS